MKSIQQLALNIADKYEEILLSNYEGEPVELPFDPESFAAGIEFMYKAMGWRDASDRPVSDDDYLVEVANKIGIAYFDVDQTYWEMEGVEVRPTRWKPLGDTLDQLQKAFEEQLNRQQP